MWARMLAVASVGSLGLSGCLSDPGFVSFQPGPPDDVSPDGGPDSEGPEQVQDLYWCCDPDVRCVCEGYWICTDGVAGKTCRQSNPDMPDGGGSSAWQCEYQERQVICTGNAQEHPDAGTDEEWTCVVDEQTGIVVCSRPTDEDDYPPDDQGGGPWDCSFSSGNEMRACSDSAQEYPDGWQCTVDADGTTRCVDETPERPDDGEWTCVQEDGRDVCQGDHSPDGGHGQGWRCEQTGEMVTCEDEQPQRPDDGQGAEWDCYWGEFLTCLDDGGSDDNPDNPEQPDNPDNPDNPDTPDGPDGGGDDCVCVVGARRYCDEPAYCLWGEQTCRERNGQRDWGHCNETAIPAGCEPGGAMAREYAWQYEGGAWDNWQQQLQDWDGDGVIEFAPDFWYNPAGQDCALRMGECVQDMWDFDLDGDIDESMGDCADIQECM